jgi:hypothetical protein
MKCDFFNGCFKRCKWVCGLVGKGKSFFQKVVNANVISRPFCYIRPIMKCPSHNGRANLRGHYRFFF